MILILYDNLMLYIKNIDSSLIIWPESVITNLIPENVGNVKTNFKLPYFGNNYPLITGALSYNDNHQMLLSYHLLMMCAFVFQ